jgi:peptide/nickel transport system permease protein
LARGTFTDRALMAGAVLGYSMPVFFLGILLILLFALQLRILPSSGAKSLTHLILPTVTLALPLSGRVARFARTAMLEVMGRPFIRTAKAKGVGQLMVILRHALPNAAVPLLMFFGIEIGLVLSGAVVTETIFAWPGLGRLLVDSVSQRDLPVVQGVILVITAIIVLSNLLVDVIHALIDPKVSMARTLGGGA